MSIFGDFFKSSPEFIDARTPEAKNAAKYLQQLIGKGTPALPERQIAGLTADELKAAEMAREFASSQPQGMGTLQDIANMPADVLQDPTVAALLGELNRQGSLEANRTARGLMTRGQTGGIAADALGRNLSDIQSRNLATLAPYAAQRTNQRLNASQILAGLGESSTLSRINALSATGGLQRQIEELQNQADYERYLTQIMFPYQTIAPIANSLANSQKLDIVMQPSDFEITSGLVKLGAGAIVGGMNPGMFGIG